MSREHLPYDQSALMRQIRVANMLKDEENYREHRFGWAAIDAHLVTATALPIAMLEKMQTEGEKQPFLKTLPGQEFISHMATTSLVDWKAVGVGAASWAVVSLNSRIVPKYRFRRESDAALEAIGAGDSFIPDTHRQTRLRRFGRKIIEGAAALTAGYIGYKAGEHGSQHADYIADASLLGVAYGRVTVEAIRDRLYDRRHEAFNAAEDTYYTPTSFNQSPAPDYTFPLPLRPELEQ